MKKCLETKWEQQQTNIKINKNAKIKIKKQDNEQKGSREPKNKKTETSHVG
jgi:hypothetical protein